MMTTEREMLEYAAKACMIDGVWQEGFGILLIGSYLNNPGELPRFWIPLTNSADCAAICAKLGIGSLWLISEGRVSCTSYDEPWMERETAFYVDHNNDREAAWRYAATMVAAKIGGMK